MMARLALVAIGVIVWGYAVRVDDQRLRLIGIGILVASLVLRYFTPRPPRPPRPPQP